jgi:hypothetical protein
MVSVLCSNLRNAQEWRGKNTSHKKFDQFNANFDLIIHYAATT